MLILKNLDLVYTKLPKNTIHPPIAWPSASQRARFARTRGGENKKLNNWVQCIFDKLHQLIS